MKKKYFRSSQQTGYENGFNDERKRISLGQKCHRCHSHTKVYAARLTLIGMRGDIFISLSFLIRFYQLNFDQTFLEVKIDIIQINLTPCEAH